jgi:DNA repair exonuclease SbcCD ATPase subunit
MSYILDFGSYDSERKKSGDVLDESSLRELESWVEDLHESQLLDEIKNRFSKLFGKFSKINLIDEIREGLMKLKKEILEKKYETQEEISDLELKMEQLEQKRTKTATDKIAIDAVEKEIRAKKEEYRSFLKAQNDKMQKGKELLQKTVGQKDRLKRYLESVESEDKLVMSEFEYELAKRHSLDASEISRLKDRIDKAKRDAKDMLSSLRRRRTP